MSGVGALVEAKLTKATKFLDMAELASEAYFDAAVSLSASAAINATDVLIVVDFGRHP